MIAKEIVVGSDSCTLSFLFLINLIFVFVYVEIEHAYKRYGMACPTP
jgi:hypothetical protein